MDVLKGFTFGFEDGEETYSPETESNFEHVRWLCRPFTILVKREDTRFVLGYSDEVVDDLETAMHEEVVCFKDFDPLTFKCVANKWYGIVPEEVT